MLTFTKCRCWSCVGLFIVLACDDDINTINNNIVNTFVDHPAKATKVLLILVYKIDIPYSDSHASVLNFFAFVFILFLKTQLKKLTDQLQHILPIVWL